MTIKFTNNATTTLASGINSSVTSLTVATGTGALFPSLSGSDVFYVTLANLTGTVEIVKVTARSSDTFTIVRGQDNTTAAAWVTGDKVELRPTAAILAAMAQTANNLSDLANSTTAANNLGLNPAGNGFKNRIINGAMVIDQRNAGASGTAGGYTVDRWAYVNSQASKGTWQKNAGSVTPPSDFKNYLGFTSSSAYSIAAGDYFTLRQSIEGFNTSDLGFGAAGASTISFSFWVRSSLTGTFGVVVSSGNASRGYPATYTISAANTWEYKTITIVGDTSGTWVGATNGTGMVVDFGLGVGSTYSASANTWGSGNILGATGATSVVGTSGATFYITGVQLEKGSTATSFDFRSIGTELALCQRYFEKLQIQNTLTGSDQSSGASRLAWFFKVTKRASPTMANYAGGTADRTDVDGFAVFAVASAATILNGATASSEL